MSTKENPAAANSGVKDETTSGTDLSTVSPVDTSAICAPETLGFASEEKLIAEIEEAEPEGLDEHIAQVAEDELQQAIDQHDEQVSRERMDAKDAEVAARLNRAGRDRQTNTSGVSRASTSQHPATEKTLVDDSEKITAALDADDKGRVFDTFANTELIMANDPDLRLLGTNTLSSAMVWADGLPSWRDSSDADDVDLSVTDADVVFMVRRMKQYFGGRHRSLSRESCMDAVLAYAAHSTRRFNPWRAHLDALPAWDGVNRVETAIPTVNPTAYSRQTFLNVYLSLMQRTFHPGPDCQVDSMLVLFGEQGTHKTSWCQSIAGGIPGMIGAVVLNDIPIGESMKDITIQRHAGVISVFDEMDQLNAKRDQKALKSDISKRTDTWRVPYGRVNETDARKFIMMGTTNDELFLSDETGGRRYWPMEIIDEIPIECMTREHQDLLLAEARDRYLAGQRLDYSPEFEKLAEAVRQNNTYDPVGEILAAWLANPISATLKKPQWVGNGQYRDVGVEVPVDRVAVPYLLDHVGSKLSAAKLGMSRKDLTGKIKAYMDARPDYEKKSSLKGVPGYNNPQKDAWQRVDVEDTDENVSEPEIYAEEEAVQAPPQKSE